MNNLCPVEEKKLKSRAAYYLLTVAFVLVSLIATLSVLVLFGSYTNLRSENRVPDDIDGGIESLRSLAENSYGAERYEYYRQIKILEYFRDNGITFAVYNDINANFFDMSYTAGPEYTARIFRLCTLFAAVSVILIYCFSFNDNKGLRLILLQRNVKRADVAFSAASVLFRKYTIMLLTFFVLQGVIGLAVFGGMSESVLIFIFGTPVFVSSGIAMLIKCLVYFAAFAISVFFMAYFTAYFSAEAGLLAGAAVIALSDLNVFTRPILGILAFSGLEAPFLYFIGSGGILLLYALISVVLYFVKKKRSNIC